MNQIINFPDNGRKLRYKSQPFLDLQRAANATINLDICENSPNKVHMPSLKQIGAKGWKLS